MNLIKRILYIQSYEFWGVPYFATDPFVTISNYLNSKKDELEGQIEEEYVDLRIEGLPDYCPENIERYREELKEFLKSIYKRFGFDIVGFACHTSLSYLNLIEVANMIKHFINPYSIVIIGGYHATVLPQDFYPKNIPSYFGDYYPKNTSPIDYINIDEAEISFFQFIQTVLKGNIKKRKTLYETPITLQGHIFKNINDLPPLDLRLLKKYKEKIREKEFFHHQLNRGCMFRCKFCPASESCMKSYRVVRSKSITKCIEEILAINNTDWLKFRNLSIPDAIFFPKRSLKDNFFKAFNNIYDQIDFQIRILERVDTCSLKDLDTYKKYNMVPEIGLESASTTILLGIGKTKITSYLDKAISLIKYSNKIDLPTVFLYMLGIPGLNKKTMKEITSFFFEEKNGEKSLIEKYKINLTFHPFCVLYGSTMYDNGEEIFGATYYYKQWWKIFDKYQYIYSTIIDPSENLSFIESVKFIKGFLKNVFKKQMKLGNPFYSLSQFVLLGNMLDTSLDIYNQTEHNKK